MIGLIARKLLHVNIFMIFLTGAALAAAADGPRAELLLSRAGATSGDWLGLHVGPAGDVNGDGIDDFLVGAPNGDGLVGSSGNVELHFGGADLDSLPDLVLEGEGAFDQFGICARGVGDVNGDGWDDVLVGAPNNDAAGGNAGRAYVFFGGPDLDAVADLVISGEAGEQLGWSVAGPGDLDGGGNDFVVGAPSSQSVAGRAYVFHGGAALDSIPDLIIEGAGSGRLGWCVNRAGDYDGDGYADLLVGANSDRYAYLFRGGAAMDSLADYSFISEGWGDRIGYGLGPAGDFNGDGWDDIVIGAMHNDAAGYDAGRAYIYYGGPAADETADLAFTGFIDRDLLGRTVDGAGDLNGDGYSDLVVGAPTPDVGGYGPGRVHVYFGGADPDTTADILITGEADSDRLGAQVAVVPDLDGDGRDDFLVGANLHDGPAGASSGRFYAYRVPDLAPVAVADSVAVTDTASVFVDVLANDFDPDGALVPGSIVIVTAPAHGLVTIDDQAGGLFYTPAPAFAGVDTLAYTVADAEGAVSEPALVVVTVSGSLAAVPGAGRGPVLAQNSPNPFNPSTSIAFTLERGGRARLDVFDVRGRLVARLLDGDLPAGEHAVRWTGRDDHGAAVGSGLYLYRLEAEGRVLTRRMTLLQ
jgi:hypothetical protein